MNILGFIPARGGSKGIPKKNLYQLNGKPLIQYTIDEAKKSKINRLVLSTDSEEIGAIAKKLGAEVPFLRSSKLADDKSVIEEAMLEMLDYLKSKENYAPDLIVLLQPTSPLRKAQHINEALELMINEKAESLISVSEPLESPFDMVYWQEKKMHFLMKDLIKPGVSQRQDYKECLFINGAVYIFTHELLRRTGSRFSEKTIPYMMPSRYSIDVDNLEQMVMAESLLKTNI